MKRMFIGDLYQIQCYKHNGKIHRSWDEAILLDVKKDYIVFGNNKTEVIEAEGTTWNTKEPAVMYFFKDKWYNIIAQMKKDGIYYYCNLASPALYDGEAIKYIDYDIDYKIFTDKTMLTLDLDEYQLHKKQMHYPKEIDDIIKEEMQNIREQVQNNQAPFNREIVEKYFADYLSQLTSQ